MNNLQHIFRQNKDWAESLAKIDPDFFSRLSSIQRPEYLWIGCSDSRVPANQITGLLPGEVFVHRNVSNIVWSTDLNVLSVLQYAVQVLGVKHVIVCGHYGCGAIKAVWDNQKLGLIDCWLSSISRIRERNSAELAAISDPETQMDRLCELNVLQQATSVCDTQIIQEAWEAGNLVSVHGWIYRLNTGRLVNLGFCVSNLDEYKELKKTL